MLISKNAYLILWLNSDSDEKALNKRYKELLNLLNIDEVWSYDNDFDFIEYSKIRTDDAIKEAFQNLSNQHKRIYQTFFWFQIVDDKDEECLNDILQWKYSEWSDKWLDLFKKSKKYHYLKNYIIAELLFFENKKKFKDLSFTAVPSNVANYLSQLLDSDNFRKEFKEIFNMQNEISVRDDMIINFRNEIKQFIAESFFDISEELSTPKLYKEYSKVSWVIAKDLDDNKNVIESIKNIEVTLKKIKSMDLGQELDNIIDWVNEISNQITILNKLWLSNNPKIIKIKDEFATEVRSMAISLFNDYDDNDNALNFIEEAKGIAHSNSLKQKLNKDTVDMNDQSEKTEMFKSILDLYTEGQDYFKNEQYKSAERIYAWLIKLILEELSEKFHFEQDKLNLLVLKIETQFNMIYSSWKTIDSVLDNIENMKKLVDEDGGFEWWDDLHFTWLWWDQRLLLRMLIDWISYRKMSHILINKKEYQSKWDSNSWSSGCWPVILKVIWWIVVLIIIAAIKSN